MPIMEDTRNVKAYLKKLLHLSTATLDSTYWKTVRISV